MTSRTPMGVPPRQPQRAPSASNLSSQRSSSSHQRGLPHQYLPPSPVRKDAVVDLTGDSADGAPVRHATTPRRGGSRLRLELSSEFDPNDPSAPSPLVDSPQILTPSRTLTMPDAIDVGNRSPALSKTSQQDADNLPIPMPKRHAFASQHIQSLQPAAPAPAPPKKDTKPKPYVIETPTAAPRFSASKRASTANRDPFSKGYFSGHADFFPWGGNHHEDEWSTEAIQKGTWDRGSQNETSSARLAIFPALKQKSGLNALSTIFMGVMNQRRHRGQITAPSTFKPPPRVTLTDTKREVWLRDLANPAISLRRLSRTIPHGIRGKTLLEQCLNKNIPTERAVWLAKCVGANEIRSFKRKGVNGAFVMGGELKWIRDWTVFVEQFVDAVVSTFNEPDWKAKVTYAIRLATNLYSEHLLDRDHYLDWIISGLENSPQARIPMWILIAQICWADLLRARKFGRRLVSVLLGHLSTIRNDPDKDILIQLSNQLTTLARSLLLRSPNNFVCPSVWLKYRDVFKSAISADDRDAKHAYDQVDARNMRLQAANTSSAFAGRQQLVKLLDSTLQNPIEQDLSTKCWATCEDKAQILRTVAEWATSVHRPGLAKVYVAAGLFRTWSTLRVGATSVILSMLDGIEPQDATRKQLVYHLVTELVRSGHFSTSQYNQWLIARGGYHDASEVAEDGPCATRLLVELPLHCLSEGQKLYRQNLLRRAGGYSVAEEASNVANALTCVDNTLGLPSSSQDQDSQRQLISMPLRKLMRRIGSSNHALKSCVGSHLRDVFTSQLARQSNFVLSPTIFTSVRSMLETIEDFPMLSEVLKACSKESNVEVLAACVDTINCNLQVFLALRSADDLFGIFLERLKSTSHEQGIVSRPLLASLSSLAPRLLGREGIAKQLSQELIQNDRSNAIDACSPVSDNMAAQGQGAEGEVADQIEKLLASGTSIDHPTMNRLFRNIVPRLEQGWKQVDESARVFASLLSRLRVFDTQHFDRLMSDWVSHVRTMRSRSALHDLFPLMVSLGCLPMATLLQTANAAPASDSTQRDLDTPNGSATYLQELLHLIITRLPSTVALNSEEAYKFYIQQQCARTEHSKALLLLIRNAIVEYSGLQLEQGHSELPLEAAAVQDGILETLKLFVVADSSAVTDNLCSGNLAPKATKMVHTIVTKLLVPGNTHAGQTSFDQILGLANELTMPFCQLKLNLDLSLTESNLTETEDQGSSRFDVFAKAMDHAIEARNIMWTSMLPCLSEDITQHLNSQAHSRFLDLVPSPKSASFTDDATSDNRIQLAENLLAVVEAIMAGQLPSKAGQLTSAFVEKLSDLWDGVVAKDETKATDLDAILKHWLPAMLRFITLHSGGPEVQHTPALGSATNKAAITPNHEARARIVLTLCSMLLELESMSQQVTATLAHQVFDIAAQLVDALPDDLRVACARTILLMPGGTASVNISSDPRLYYLFSVPPLTPADNLKLAHRDKSSMPHSATARGMSAMYGLGPTAQERHRPFVLRRWEVLSEPTPNVGENDTSLSLGLFEAIKIQ